MATELEQINKPEFNQEGCEGCYFNTIIGKDSGCSLSYDYHGTDYDCWITGIFTIKVKGK